MLPRRLGMFSSGQVDQLQSVGFSHGSFVILADARQHLGAFFVWNEPEDVLEHHHPRFHVVDVGLGFGMVVGHGDQKLKGSQ
jgi:hypothetical protein